MIHHRKAAGEALCQCLLHIPKGHLKKWKAVEKQGWQGRLVTEPEFLTSNVDTEIKTQKITLHTPALMQQSARKKCKSEVSPSENLASKSEKKQDLKGVLQHTH